MIVEVTAAQGVQLTQAHDLKALHVTCDADMPVADVHALLGRSQVGRIERDCAFLDISQLRALRARQGFTDHEDFDAMVRYAQAHNWLTPDGRAVQAHIKRSTPTPTTSTKGHHNAQ